MGISIWQLLIILVIVLLVFGAKKLKSLGGDLGGAVKGFKESMNEAGNDETNGNRSKQEPPAVANQSAENNESNTAKSEEKNKV